MNSAIKTGGVYLQVQLMIDGDYIVSYCPALELSFFGNTEEDAKEGFEEALNIFIDELHKRGTLEKNIAKFRF